MFARWDAMPQAAFARLGIPVERLKAFQAGLQGYIVVPGDPTYDDDRMLFNPVFDNYPRAIVYCSVVPDVAIALQMARATQQPVAVRSGGHCTAGFSSGPGMLVDVSALSTIAVDSGSLTATVGTGCNFGTLDATLNTYGLHVPGGECPDVCVGGYVQGGGYGFTSVTFGMNCDNVLSMQVMLQDGSLVNASPTENYDLWWAMRGGTGNNFGVLLSVTYQLRPLGDCFGWALAWPLSTSTDIANAANVLMLLQQKYMRTSPYAPQMNIQVSFVYQTQLMPNGPISPQPLPYMLVRGLYVGDQASGSAAIAPLQQLAGCVTQWTMMSTFMDLNDKLLNYPQGLPNITTMPYEDKSSRYIARDLTLQEWTSILQYFQTSNPTLAANVYGYLEFYGGAIASYDRDKSAFVHRDVAFNAVMDVFWWENTQRSAAEHFLQGWNALLAPMWNGGVYQNYCSLNMLDYISAYWGSAIFGLWAVKLKYAPGDVFAYPQAVRSPIGPGGGVGPEIQLPPALQAALALPIKYLVQPQQKA
jgi:FAD binding domain